MALAWRLSRNILRIYYSAVQLYFKTCVLNKNRSPERNIPQEIVEYKFNEMNTALKIIRSLNYLKYRHPRGSPLNGLQNNYRNIHTSQNMNVKMYMEHENHYAYSIMENKGYASKLKTDSKCEPIEKDNFEHLIGQNWNKKSPQEIYEIFPVLGTYCAKNGLCISNKIFDDYIDNLTDSIKHASEKELEFLFHSLVKWPETESIRTRNYIEVWAALDDECLSRHKNWSVDQLLTFLSLFFLVNVSRVCDYSTKALQRITNKVNQLTPEQLVQTMFFIGANRKSPYDVHNLEVYLEDNFSKFSLDELAILSMGFFKSKTPIRSHNILEMIIDKIIEHSTEVHEVSLAALLKVIRYSMKSDENNKIYQLLDSVQHEVPRLSVMCNVHVALLGTATLTLHKACLTRIADTVINSISKTRLKDLERLVFTFGTFNHRPNTKQCFFQMTMDELRKQERESEILKFGRSFACTVAYLGMLDIYPIDLMNKILSPQFLFQTYGKYCHNYGKEILTIQNTADIYCSNDTKMSSIDVKKTTILAKKYTDYCPSERYQKQYNFTEKMFLDVMGILKQSRGGEEFVTADHILTHHQRGDIIICNSFDGSPLPVANVFSSASFGVLRKPPDNNQWIALVITARNGIIKNTGTPTGPFLSKIRDLNALGFHAALVLWNKYTTCTTASEKKDYLNEIIKEATNKSITIEH